MPPTTPPEAVTPPRRRGLWMFVLIVLVALAAGGGAWWFATQRMGSVSEAPRPPVFVNLEPFTVNLQPNGRSRYLHVAISLKVNTPHTQSLLTTHLPEVRSRVLTVLANRDADALLLPEEKEKLSTELMASLGQPYGKHPALQGISQVMFTTFMLQ